MMGAVLRLEKGLDGMGWGAWYCLMKSNDDFMSHHRDDGLIGPVLKKHLDTRSSSHLDSDSYNDSTVHACMNTVGTAVASGHMSTASIQAAYTYPPPLFSFDSTEPRRQQEEPADSEKYIFRALAVSTLRLMYKTKRCTV